MTFRPRMQNRIGGFTVIEGLHRRWNGIVADLWDVECAPQAGGYYIAKDPRIFIVLDVSGGDNCNIRLSPGDHGTLQNYRHQSISYIPAGMELWAECTDQQRIRHLDLHFDLETLSRRLADDFEPQLVQTPRLMFSDPRILTLAQLIAGECVNPQPLHDLYGDGISLALIIDILKLQRPLARKRGQLPAWRLRRAVDYIEENCLRSVRLEELAELTGLSQSQFSHAFKASTGIAPHQWQMNARIEKAKQLLLANDLPLTKIAADMGFADQAHFTRVFRRNVGAPPALWKKMKLL